MKGWLHPTKNHLLGGFQHLVRTFLHLDDSFEWMYLFSGVATSRDSNGEGRGGGAFAFLREGFVGVD